MQTDLSVIARIEAPITLTEGLLDLWLHGKSPHTQRYYRREARKFLAAHWQSNRTDNTG